MNDFIKEYGIGSFIILLACALGVLNIGLVFGYAISDKLLFLTIGITFLIIYNPKLWGVIKGIANKVVEWLKGLFKSEE
jgi:hypothetical protein